MKRLARYAVSVATVCFGIVTQAAADPVSVTSGFLFIPDTSGNGAPISLAGTRGFSLTGLASPPPEGRVDVFEECDPVCLPGDTISITAVFVGTALTGVGMLDGQGYALTGGIQSPDTARLDFVGTAVIPQLSDDSAIVRARFSLMGLLFTDIFTNGPSTSLGGQGFATLDLVRAPPITGIPPGWAFDQIRYDFADPSPVPEPATFTLLATGLGSLVLGARRRARRTSQNQRP